MNTINKTLLVVFLMSGSYTCSMDRSSGIEDENIDTSNRFQVTHLEHSDDEGNFIPRSTSTAARKCTSVAITPPDPTAFTPANNQTAFFKAKAGDKESLRPTSLDVYYPKGLYDVAHEKIENKRTACSWAELNHLPSVSR